MREVRELADVAATPQSPQSTKTWYSAEHRQDSQNKMWSVICFCFVILTSVTNCQEDGLDYSEQDYSTKLQQFLLQKIKEAETWTGEEEFENLSEGKRGRQDLTDDDDEDDDDELPEIIDEDITDNEDSNEEEIEEAEEEDEGEDEGEDGEGEEEVVVVEETSEVTVLNTAPFLMSSLVSDLNADIVLQEVIGSDRLRMICKISGESEIFSNPTCLPQIYLVAGQTDCNSLTQVTTLIPQSSANGESLSGVLSQAACQRSRARGGKNNRGCDLVRVAGEMSGGLERE